MDAKTKITLRDPALFRQQCYVNGEWIDAGNGATLDVDNPATGEIIGAVPALGAAETRAAIEAADAAWAAWRARPAKARANLMRRWFDLVMEHQEDLAVLMTSEQGKPLAESRGEIAYAASFIEWFAEEGEARLRRRHQSPPTGEADRGAEAADRGRRHDHAVELPRPR